MFETIWNAAVKTLNMFKAIFLDWRADPRRDEQWYDNTKKNLPNTYRSQYPARPEDAFTVGEGAFFPEWDEEGAHVVYSPDWYPPSYCQIHAAYDAGYGSRACFKWYAVYPEGYAIAYREYYPQAVTDPLQAQEIKRMSVDPRGEPENIVSIVADPSCWNRQSGTGESTADVFARYGLYMSKADNDLSNGWRRLHQWLMPFDTDHGKVAMLRFTYGCPHTIRTYPGCIQKKTDPEDIANTCEHHCQDVDRYFVMSRPEIIDAESFLPGSDPGRKKEQENFDTYFPDDDDDDDGAGFYGM
jgi:hypothetical protein